jgi:malic enzyme
MKGSHMSAVKVVVDFVVRALSASAVMTVSQHIEIRITHRPDSDLPVRVIETVTGRSIPRGVISVMAGQLAQGMLAAAAIALARLARRSPTAPAVLVGVLFLVSFNAIVLRVLGLGDMPWRWS